MKTLDREIDIVGNRFGEYGIAESLKMGLNIANQNTMVFKETTCQRKQYLISLAWKLILNVITLMSLILFKKILKLTKMVKLRTIRNRPV